MATKIRLQRHGKKGKPFYHVVAADARAKRDGRFIEKIGTYNPNTNPATIEVKHDRALYWLGVGAQPTDTARAILKHTGAIYHNHLLKGVAKGAITEAEATKKFEAWYSEKQSKIDAKRKNLTSAAEKEQAALISAEKKISEERAAKIAAAASEMAAEAEAVAEAAANAEVAEETPAEEAAPETEATAEEAQAEEAAPEAEAATEETPAEEAAPETEAATEEAPAEEAAPEDEATAEEASAEESAPEAEAATEEAPAEEEAAEEEKKEEE